MRHLFWAMSAALAAPGCSQPSDPDAAGPSDSEPALEAPAAAADAKPLHCSVAVPDPAGWASENGPYESLPRQLAATSDALYVASPYALRRSLDAGASFEVIDGPAEAAWPQAMAALAGSLFIAVPGGVATSADNGATWSDASSGLVGDVLTFHSNASALMAATNDGKLYRWSASQHVWSGVEGATSWPIGAADWDGTTVLVDTGAGVVRSTDLSEWNLVSGLEAWGYKDLLIDEQIGIAITEAGEIRRSVDAGQSWVPTGQTAEQLGAATRVLQSGDALFATTSEGVVRSGDQGQSWSVVLHQPEITGQGALVSGGGLVAAGQTAIAVSVDGGAVWSDAASFVDSTPVAFARFGPWLLTSTASKAAFAQHEGGTFQTTNIEGYVLRDTETAADATYLLFAERNPGEYAFSSSWVTRTVDGETFDTVPLPNDEVVLGRSFETMAVTEQRALVVGGIDAFSTPAGRGPGIWISDDEGASWVEANQGLPRFDTGAENGGSYPAVLSLSRRGDALLALLDDVGVYESRDDGLSWHPLGNQLGAEAAANAEAALVVGGDVLVSSRIEDAPLRWLDGDTVTQAWRTLEAEGLPTHRSITAVLAHGSALVIAVQTPPGAPGSDVYISNDGGRSFQALGLGARVRSLFIDGTRLLAGVDGQGVASIELGSCL